MAFVWLVMMLVWLGGLLYGLWWVWPHFERMALTAELFVSLFWLVTGAVAWVVALNIGRQRYWRRYGRDLRCATAGRSAVASLTLAEPPSPPAPKFREVMVPADTTLTVKLETPVASDKSQVEDEVRGTLAKPIVIAGETVVPAGAELAGTVTESSKSGRVGDARWSPLPSTTSR